MNNNQNNEAIGNLKGHIHPLSQMLEEITAIFFDMGFSVAEGPEVESEHYNFDTLNIPEHHPARDMWDTFWLKQSPGLFARSDHTESDLGLKLQNAGKLLRTHTSPVQVRYMEENSPPLAIIAPGKVYRHEATDATHEAQFYQLEGLMIGEDISLAHMKGVLERFFEKFFGSKVVLRLRPSYFPFVEPGVEVDMSCFKCHGKGLKPSEDGLADSQANLGCSVCKQSGWIEIMGAGMVHPKVLSAAGVDASKFQGFAFGAGIDRFAMLKYGIDDVRLLYSGDLRFVNQF